MTPKIIHTDTRCSTTSRRSRHRDRERDGAGTGRRGTVREREGEVCAARLEPWPGPTLQDQASKLLYSQRARLRTLAGTGRREQQAACRRSMPTA
ncbi:hypothetical protein PoB_002370500 [Plakobranchus ocellatus]|uniref:Uncharacterized protein n=1 Tax=Plakobranchus ocellatus TaxID=259542 RepID=A0AAV3ZPX2_9GAST|nr:hypothetical protein PoB_002370500 [Plakobranchus ocellatus]